MIEPPWYVLLAPSSDGAFRVGTHERAGGGFTFSFGPAILGRVGRRVTRRDRRRSGRSGRGLVWALLAAEVACALAWALTGELLALVAAVVAGMGLLVVLRP